MHIEKFKRGAVGQMLAHVERDESEKSQNRNFGNKDIKKELSHLNYRLDDEKDSLETYHQILKREDVKVSNRKDLNTFCSVCLTLPDDVEKEDENKFFESAFEFLKDRYANNDNLISCDIHKDENRSHMHFLFVPLVLDERYKDKTGIERYKVSAKERITKFDLQTLHTDMSEHIEKKLGYKVSILTEKEELNKDIRQCSSAEIKRMFQQKLKRFLPVREYKMFMDSVDVMCAIFDESEKIEQDKILNEIQKSKNIEDTVKIFNQQYSLEQYIQHNESARGFNEYYENKHFHKRDNRLRSEINQSWKEYQRQSEGYWGAYKRNKEVISNALKDTNKDLYKAKYELDRAISNLYRINGGIFTFLFKVIVLLSAYFNKKELEQKANELKQANENLNKQRKIVSALQNDTKIALKSEDIESINNALETWESAIYELTSEVERSVKEEVSILDTEKLENDDLLIDRFGDDVLDER